MDNVIGVSTSDVIVLIVALGLLVWALVHFRISPQPRGRGWGGMG
jgi:hypothetical protein